MPLARIPKKKRPGGRALHPSMQKKLRYYRAPMFAPPDPVPIKSLPEAGTSSFPRFTLLVETQVSVPAESD